MYITYNGEVGAVSTNIADRQKLWAIWECTIARGQTASPACPLAKIKIRAIYSHSITH